jgi:nitrate reductase NapE component
LIHRFIGFWVLRRAWRLLAADDARPLRARLTAEAKRILVGAVVTFALVLVAAIAAIGVLIWLLV